MSTVCYIGNFAVPWTTENDVRRAFETLGWHVVQIQEADFIDAAATGRTQPIARKVLASDLVLHTLTQGSMPRLRNVTQLWDACRTEGIPTASIHLDLFYGLGSPKARGPQRRQLPRVHPMFKVDHVFTADGGHDDAWQRDGVNHHWLPPGVSHVECVDVEPIPELVGRYDVGFCGSDTNYHREWPHRARLVQWLRDTYGDRFLHAAGGSTRRTLRGVELNRVYASVPVWVGDSCMTAPDFAYWSDRVPETWGRGGFLIHPRVDALNAHMGSGMPGSSWVAGDWDALRQEIDAALLGLASYATAREQIAAIVRGQDTYLHRVQTILDVVFPPETVDIVDGSGALVQQIAVRREP